ncbi:MAG: cysteine desulfurase [Pseudomonadota bacterium]
MENIAQKEVLEHEANESFDIDKIRNLFPVLHRTYKNHQKLAYLDNAASSQMPLSVINRLHRYHQYEHSNVHRSVHTLGEEATLAYESTRKKIAQFINAKSDKEIIFTRGTTDSINLVMQSYGKPNVKQGDEILISMLEHHSNIVPWQMLCEQNGCQLRVIPIDNNGEIKIDKALRLITQRTKIVALTQISNAIGTINPLERIISRAKKVGAVTVIDGAQAIAHTPVNVQQIDCDFYAFSGHKMYGPTGIGILYSKAENYEKMIPYLGGGDMILHVSFDETIYNDPPHKFEAGTPPIAAAIGLGEAVDFIKNIGFSYIAQHEKQLIEYAHEKMLAINDIKLIGTKNLNNKSSVVSFVFDDIHAHDVGSLLNSFGVAIRAGHHCAQPVMEYYNVAATSRASFALYNTPQEIDMLTDAVKEMKNILS